MSLSTKEKREKPKGFDWDLFFRIASVIATLVTVWVGIWQYRQNVEREFRKNYYERQMVVYNELIDICSKIANWDVDSLDTPAFREMEMRLHENYFGKLSLFQNADVASRVKEFRESLRNFKRGDVTDDNSHLQKLCFCISDACRKSLDSTYGLQLNDVYTSFIDSSGTSASDTSGYIANSK